MTAKPDHTEKTQRQRAREERQTAARAEREAAERGRRKRSLRQVAAAALVVVAAMIALQETTLPGRDAPAPPDVTQSLFRGIPQDGYTLGDPDAPVTVVEFVDMQCPFCATFSNEQLEPILEKYVRTGKVKLELRTLAFIGPDSIRAGQAVQAAAEQDKAWDFAHAFFERQGPENGGYVNDEFLAQVSAAVAGLDADAIQNASDGQGIAQAETEAKAASVESTPSFVVDGKLVTGDEVAKAIEAAL